VKRIALLGSTGSIGVSTLALVREFPDRFKVSGMAAGQNLTLLAKQIKEFSPAYVAIQHEKDVPRLRRLIGNNKVEILFGEAVPQQSPRRRRSTLCLRRLSAARA